ncbi:c-type cytochrome [Larkinella terrae]|uniref:Cytochrome C n=1 Tax=Larkinella terrae TaxID=2025311 RepID=A0A7K0EKN6_9BACT|nr:c-type cytochrome [Larkinella terrae]MRS62282.1 cytochrome C [Larkinella terrae]
MKKTFGMLLAVALTAVISASNAQAQTVIPEDVKALLQKNICLACHNPDTRLVGPPYKEVAKKKYTDAQIVELIYDPKPEHWPGYPPMAALKNVPKDEALKIAAWINSLDGGAKKDGAKKPAAKKKAT